MYLKLINKKHFWHVENEGLTVVLVLGSSPNFLKVPKDLKEPNWPEAEAVSKRRTHASSAEDNIFWRVAHIIHKSTRPSTASGSFHSTAYCTGTQCTRPQCTQHTATYSDSTVRISINAMIFADDNQWLFMTTLLRKIILKNWKPWRTTTTFLLITIKINWT